MATQIDLIIQNGRVIDPANNVDRITNVLINDGKVVMVSDTPSDFKPKEVYDASGCLVTPGLIDMHTHVYEFATPLGVNPDETCLARGVTTVVDAGSAGAATFPGLRKYVCERSKTRVLAFVHISSHGLSCVGCAGEVNDTGGECDSLNQVDTNLCVKCTQENKDIAVGVKIRLTTMVANNDGQTEKEAYRRALSASSEGGVPLMVHYCWSSIPINVEEGFQDLSCPGSLKKGDILTHAFHGGASSIIDNKTKTLHPSVHRARNRGVLFDVGHGLSSFSWTVAEHSVKEKFWPDVISTDLHRDNVTGPAYDLPIAMTKLLHLGMPLNDVIKAVTMAPASAIGWQDRIGSLSPNYAADITVLKVENVNLEVEDCLGQIRNIEKQIVPVAVWKDGIQYKIKNPDAIPGHDTGKLLRQWDEAEIKYPERPNPRD